MNGKVSNTSRDDRAKLSHPIADRSRLTAREVLDEHVKLFNFGVRTRDFGPMISQFSKDAEMYFEGIPVGPFKGRPAISEAYSSRPPDDEIIILSVKWAPGKNEINGEYAWSRNAKVRAGELRIETKRDQIMKLTVRYESH